MVYILIYLNLLLDSGHGTVIHSVSKIFICILLPVAKTFGLKLA